MQNVVVTVKGDKLTIEVDLSKRFGKSASGKTTIIASTQGNVPILHPSNPTIGFNCYTKDE